MGKSNSMYHWRVTKYNLKYRDENGAYLRDEWTIFREVGKIFDGKKVTISDYLVVEDNYIEAILSFMDCLHIGELKLTSLNKANRPIENEIYSQEMIDVYGRIKNRYIASRSEVAIIACLILRHNIWCRLKSDDMYVHFGWDYYMYIGTKNECKRARAIRVIC